MWHGVVVDGKSLEEKNQDLRELCNLTSLKNTKGVIVKKKKKKPMKHVNLWCCNQSNPTCILNDLAMLWNHHHCHSNHLSFPIVPPIIIVPCANRCRTCTSPNLLSHLTIFSWSCYFIAKKDVSKCYVHAHVFSEKLTWNQPWSSFVQAMVGVWRLTLVASLFLLHFFSLQYTMLSPLNVFVWRILLRPLSCRNTIAELNKANWKHTENTL